LDSAVIGTTGYALSLHAWSPSPPPIPPSPPPPSTLASLTFKLSLAMARLYHRCAAKCRERCESRGEDLHRRCTYPPFFAFVTSIAALAAAAAAAAPTTCATSVTLYITGLATARAVRTVAAKSRRYSPPTLIRVLSPAAAVTICRWQRITSITALLTPRRRG